MCTVYCRLDLISSVTMENPTIPCREFNYVHILNMYILCKHCRPDRSSPKWFSVTLQCRGRVDVSFINLSFTTFELRCNSVLQSPTLFGTLGVCDFVILCDFGGICLCEIIFWLDCRLVFVYFVQWTIEHRHLSFL